MLHVYLTYVLVALLVGLGWSSVASWVGPMSAELVLVALGLIAVSGVPGLFFSRRSTAGERAAAVLMVLGSVAGAGRGLRRDGAIRRRFVHAWAVPGGEIAVRVDALAAMFLVPLLIVAPARRRSTGSSTGPSATTRDDGRKLRLFYGLQSAGIGLVLVAANAVLFLLAWETMALAAFFCITTEDRDEAVRQSGYVYLVATRFGTLLLVRDVRGDARRWRHVGLRGTCPSRRALRPRRRSSCWRCSGSASRRG